jgi:hypothetical protein
VQGVSCLSVKHETLKNEIGVEQFDNSLFMLKFRCSTYKLATSSLVSAFLLLQVTHVNLIFPDATTLGGCRSIMSDNPSRPHTAHIKKSRIVKLQFKNYQTEIQRPMDIIKQTDPDHPEYTDFRRLTEASTVSDNPI